MPVYWPDGVRHAGDTSPICCFRVEQEKAHPETDPAGEAGKRECPERP